MGFQAESPRSDYVIIFIAVDRNSTPFMTKTVNKLGTEENFRLLLPRDLKNAWAGPGTVAHAYNPSTLGG